MDYPGWDIETTHPVDPEAEGFCQVCADAVPQTVAYAIDWGSHSHQVTDPQGTVHHIAARPA